jgi:hypothetical protein
MVNEKITWQVQKNVMALRTVTGKGITNKLGEVLDNIAVPFTSSKGIAGIRQDVVVGNWNAVLYSLFYATGDWNANMAVAFK